MVLDNGNRWDPEGFQLEVMDDIFTRVPEIWMVVPEGNGKTTLMGGVALYFADYTPSASVLLGAASRDQCGLLLGQAAGFVYRTPGLNRTRFRVYEGYRRIEAVRTAGRIQVFSADDRTGDGVIPGGIVLLDELHRHRDLRLYRTWRGKLDKRGAQMVAISTAGEPETEFENARAEIIKTAEVTRRGAHTRAASPGIILHDWSVPAGADIEDMAAVKEANPFSGVTVEKLARKRASATTTLSHWQRFVCNQATRMNEAAITEQEWAARRSGERIPPGVPVWAGLDLGWKWDTTAAVPLWLDGPDRRFIGDPKILTPPRDGTSLDPAAVQEALLQIHQVNPIHSVVMDENAGGAQLSSWIETTLGARVISHSQGHAAMALAYERWMEALRQGQIFHTGDPELARHVLNAVARLLPGGQTRFDRPARSRSATSQDQRVWDALTAASMVHSVAVGAESAPQKSDFVMH